MTRPYQRTEQLFTKDTSNEAIKEALDRIIPEYPNIVDVTIKWNATNCTLFVHYIEVRPSREEEDWDD